MSKIIPYDEEELLRQLQNPSLEFVEEDSTLEAWLYRISLWGKLTFVYRSDTVSTRELDQREVVKKLSSELNTKGRWKTNRTGVNTLVMRRTWIKDRKAHWEEIVLTVDLRPELKSQSLWRRFLRKLGIGK